MNKGSRFAEGLVLHPFHVLIHRMARSMEPSFEVSVINGVEVRVITQAGHSLGTPFLMSFEDVLERLSTLSRMFTEPDGSFVWAIAPESQLDGQLHDGASGLMTVEVKGKSSSDTWHQLLTCLGWPDERLVIQLVSQGIFLESDDFDHALNIED